jgi:hypothetical protein
MATASARPNVPLGLQIRTLSLHCHLNAAMLHQRVFETSFA